MVIDRGLVSVDRCLGESPPAPTRRSRAGWVAGRGALYVQWPLRIALALQSSAGYAATQLPGQWPKGEIVNSFWKKKKKKKKKKEEGRRRSTENKGKGKGVAGHAVTWRVRGHAPATSIPSTSTTK